MIRDMPTNSPWRRIRNPILEMKVLGGLELFRNLLCGKVVGRHMGRTGREGTSSYPKKCD